jgi:hypothetical protein
MSKTYCPHCGKEIDPAALAAMLGFLKSEAKARASQINGKSGERRSVILITSRKLKSSPPKEPFWNSSTGVAITSTGKRLPKKESPPPDTKPA